jgi:predicted HTH transcriptional regulator
MANSDGGTLVLGIEDDGTPTGVDYPRDRLDVILQAPQRLANPPLKAHHRRVFLGAVQVLVLAGD